MPDNRIIITSPKTIFRIQNKPSKEAPMKQIQHKKKTSLIVLLLLTAAISIIAVHLYSSCREDEIDYSSYTGTYATAAQVSRDCRYICISKQKNNKSLYYVTYKQNKPQSVSSGTATVCKHGVSLQYDGETYTLKLYDHSAVLHCSEFTANIDKIDNTPVFINNNHASRTFDKLLEETQN